MNIETFKSNVESIRIALDIHKTNRQPSPEEVKILSAFRGFGGMKFLLYPPEDFSAFSKSDLKYQPLCIKLHEILKEYSKDNDEYERLFLSIKSSVLTSFYTNKLLVDGIERALKNNSINIRHLLDPCSGSGTFLGLSALKKSAVEIDRISYLILKALRGNDAEVLNCSYEEIKPNRFSKIDAIISNSPFADVKVYDPMLSNSKDKMTRYSCSTLHTYFFEKSLSLVSDGGLVGFITSTGFLDSPSHTEFREHLLKKANLVSIIRLPIGTFEDTQVMSDFILLQKNEGKKRQNDNERLLRNIFEVPEVGVKYNGYFHMHPEAFLCTSRSYGSDPYGKMKLLLHYDGDINSLSQRFSKMLTMDISKWYSKKIAMMANTPVQLDLFAQLENSNEFTFTNTFSDFNSLQTDGEYVGLCIGSSTAEKIFCANDNEKRLYKDYILLRDTFLALNIYEQENLKANEELRTKLNLYYDRFVADFGNIRNNIGLLEKDSYFPQIKGLETVLENKIVKSDIFFKPVAFKIESESMTSLDAMYLCLNEKNKVDIDFICQKTSLEEVQVLNELKDKILFNPISGGYDLQEIFLSGDIYSKISRIENLRTYYENDPKYSEFENSLSLLKSVVPEKIPLVDIAPSFGERWIPASIFAKYLSDMTGETVNVRYSSFVDEFSVTSKGGSGLLNANFGIKSISRYYRATEVFRFALLDIMPDMTYTEKLSDGTEIRRVDEEGVQRMTTKISSIRDGFCPWMMTLDAEQRNHLEDLYNRMFNGSIKTKFDGSYMTFPGLDYKSLKIESLYKSQKDAILMLLHNYGGIIDHEVGGGKTLIQCIAAYEMKRLGIARKPLIIGLRTNVKDLATTFKKAYPSAKLLYADEKSFSKAKRELFFENIQNNDWDCVIMSHDQFLKIPQSLEVQKSIIVDEIQKIDDCLKVQMEMNPDARPSARTFSGLEKRKKNLEAKLNGIIDTINSRTDKVVDFKTMGLDHIFVDESHKFKNLMIQTRHQRVSGIGNVNGNQKTFNLLTALRTIQAEKGRDLCATFLSGTTISNSLTELYNIFSYLRPEGMKEQNIYSFDGWASIFSRKTKDYEFGVTNNIIRKERFRYFTKIPELALFYSMFTDYKTAADIGIDRPEGVEELIQLKQTPQQEMMFERLKEFAKTGNGELIFRQPLSDSEARSKMLIATTTAKAASLDMRLVNDKLFHDEEGNKSDVVSRKVYEIYRKFDEQKGTQFIFSDLGTYSDDHTFNIYSDVKNKLVNLGVPENEIQFIQKFKTDDQKDKLFKAMNDGFVRVLFGSTETLGTGVNAQKRCVAIHHMDIPWRPSDMEQRNGRGVRKDNLVAKKYNDNKVNIYIYGTERTLDAYKFTLLRNKALFISQIKSNKAGLRVMDDGAFDEDTGMNYAEYMAALSGKTELLEKNRLEKQLNSLVAEEKTFIRDLHQRERNIARIGDDIVSLKKDLALLNEDYSHFLKLKSKGEFEHFLDGAVIHDLESVGKRLYGFTQLMKPGEQLVEVGHLGNFKIVVYKKSSLEAVANGESSSVRLGVKGTLLYTHNNGICPKNPEKAGTFCINALEKIPEYIQRYEEKIRSSENLKEGLEKMQPVFPHTDKIKELKTKIEELTEKINEEIKKEDEVSNNNSNEKPSLKDIPLKDVIGLNTRLTGKKQGL